MELSKILDMEEDLGSLDHELRNSRLLKDNYGFLEFEGREETKKKVFYYLLNKETFKTGQEEDKFDENIYFIKRLTKVGERLIKHDLKDCTKNPLQKKILRKNFKIF
jgi:hypothetical protein